MYQMPPSGPVGSGAAKMTPNPNGPYRVGDQVEIFSKSMSSWCQGSIDRAEGGLVSIRYKAPNGDYICKVLPNGHEDIRFVSAGGAPPTSNYGNPQSATPRAPSASSREAGTRQSLESFRRQPDNEECADCGQRGPEWASLRDGTLVCLECAGVHRCMALDLKSVAHPELWTAAEASPFVGMGGNICANRRLAELAGLAAPRPPPDTDRCFLERYIVKKYRGSTNVDSYQCQEASRLLARELTEELEQRRLAREKAEREAAEAAERQRREQAERAARAERAAKEAAAKPLHPGGFRDANASVQAVPGGRAAALKNDVGGPMSGLVVVDILAVNLVKERVQDLRYMGAWSLNLSVVMSMGKVSAPATANRKGSASVRWEPPEQRELRWDCRERWLWCRVNDTLMNGNTQIAGVGVVDVRAAEAEACEQGTGMPAAEMELDLVAKDPSGRSFEERDADHLAWQVSVGHHGPPGPPGAHGHYVYEQVEDLDHVAHGQTCGSVILRITVIDPASKVDTVPMAPASRAAAPPASQQLPHAWPRPAAGAAPGAGSGRPRPS